MFTAMRKKYAKLTAFRTIKRRNGRMRAVSTRACPELPLKCLNFLITTTSSYPHCKSLPVAVPVTGGVVSAPSQVPVTTGQRIGVTFAGTAPSFGSIGRVLYNAPSVGVVDNLLSPLTEGLPIVPTLTGLTVVRTS